MGWCSSVSLAFIVIEETKPVLYIDVTMATTHASTNLSKTDVCAVNLAAAIFGDQKNHGF